MRLLDLPAELVLYIAETLDGDRDILALMQTCRFLAVSLKRILFANNILLNNSSSLWWAALKGRVDMATVALQNGVSPNCMSRTKRYSILHYAALWQNGPIVELLLQQGADPNIRDHKGFTPLSLCMHQKFNPGRLQSPGTSYFSPNDRKWDKIIDLLLANGADPTIKRLDISPLDLAVLCGDTVVVKKLLQHGAEQNNTGERCHLFKAVSHHSTDMVEALLQYGANPNYVTPNGDKILHLAAGSGNAHIVKALLAHGAEPDAYSNGDTALHRALASTWGVRAAKQLLDSGANPQLRDSNGGGDTPLQRCASKNRFGGMKLLLQYDPDPEIQAFFANASPSDYGSPRAKELLARKGLLSHRLWEGTDLATILADILSSMSLY